MNDNQIRFCRENDVPQLINLMADHAAYEKSSFESKGKLEAIHQYLFQPDPPLFCLVIANETGLSGYATYMKQFSTWDANFYVYLDCLYLKEAARGQGLGKELMLRIKEEAETLNCALIQWQTPDFNDSAIRFYKRLGANAKSKERFFWE